MKRDSGKATRRFFAALGIAGMVYIMTIACMHGVATLHERTRPVPAIAVTAPPWTPPACETGAPPFTSQECYPNP